MGRCFTGVIWAFKQCVLRRIYTVFIYSIFHWKFSSDIVTDKNQTCVGHCRKLSDITDCPTDIRIDCYFANGINRNFDCG